MPIIKVLTNAKGDVIGTARAEAGASGPGAPQHATLVAGPGQRVFDIDLDDELARLDATKLHAAIRSRQVSGKASSGRKKIRPAKAKAKRRKRPD